MIGCPPTVVPPTAPSHTASAGEASTAKEVALGGKEDEFSTPLGFG